MAERGLISRPVVVVEQHELLRKRVVVRRHVAPEQHERRIAVPLRHVSEHLVIGAVLLDDVEDVPDRGGLPEVHRDRARAWRVAVTVVVPLVVAERGQPPVVPAHLTGEVLQLAAAGHFQDRHDSLPVLVAPPPVGRVGRSD